MDGDSILLMVVGAGAGGAFGGLIAGLAARPLSVDWRRWIVILGVVASASLGAWLAPKVAAAMRPPPNPAALEDALLADPALGELAAAWKARDPASFAGLVSRLTPGALDGARGELIAAARPRLVLLSDAETVQMIRVSGDQMRALATAHPVACHPLFHGRRFGDISIYLSEDLRAREVALLTAALRADPAATLPTLEGDALTSALGAVVADTRATFGEDISLLAPDAAVEDREPRVCEAAAALYETMEALPEARAAALMRGLMALAG